MPLKVETDLAYNVDRKALERRALNMADEFKPVSTFLKSFRNEQ
jgi:hypothetical protein